MTTSVEPAPTRPRIVTAWRLLTRAAREGVVALAVGLLVGTVTRDRVVPTALLYSGIAPIGMVLLGVAFLALARRRWPARSAIIGAATLVALLRIVAVDTAWPGEASAEARAPLRLVHWNVGHGVFRLPRIGEILAADAPDVLLLSEPPRIEPVAMPGALGMARASAHVARDMALLTRWPFTIEEGPPAASGLRSFVARIEAPGGQAIVLVAADVVSDPLRSRAPAFEALTEWIEERLGRDPDAALLLVGDLNTPRGSVFVDPLRARVASAYEQPGGGGWPYTWPMPLPMLAIDHTFVSPALRVVRYRLRAAACSDHLRQVVDLDIDPES